MRVVAAVFALMLLAVGCGEQDDDVPAGEHAPYAYRLSIEGWTVWAAPATGSWRTEGVDSSGARQVHVFADGRYFRSIGKTDTDTYARVGSPGFLGANGDEPDFLRVVSASEPLTAGQVVGGIRVEERVPLAVAQRRGLFDVPVEEAAWIDRELEPGVPPPLPIEAYWFGPELAERRAFTAGTFQSPEGMVHVTCYGDPEEIAAGKTHCLPGRPQPRREVQVVSRTLDGPLVRRELARLERGGRGRTIRLGNGEAVVVYPSAIVTRRTLVTVVGSIDLRRLAPSLRRL